ncbi:hypothetical protein HYQ46_010849 [Verticillium longisporum]|nr:hypothetical protein HYQ46_010849 [Verticillium longisporum]
MVPITLKSHASIDRLLLAFIPLRFCLEKVYQTEVHEKVAFVDHFQRHKLQQAALPGLGFGVDAAHELVIVKIHIVNESTPKNAFAAGLVDVHQLVVSVAICGPICPGHAVDRDGLSWYAQRW